MSDLDWAEILDDDEISSDKQQDLDKDELSFSHKLHKTEEEINKFAVDEGLDEVERALLLLKPLTPLVQKLSVLSHLPSLFHDHPVDAKSKILPAALIILLSEPAKYQVAAADALLQVISENTIAPKTMQSFIPYCKKLLYQPDCGKWDDLFIACIKSITLDSIDADVLTETNLDAVLKHPSSYRQFCCRILGAVAIRFSPKKIESLLLPKVKILCQDTDYEVRAEMATHLSAISKSLGLQSTIKELLSEFIELFGDEEQVVRESSINSFLSLVDILDEDAKTNILILQYRKQCESPNRILYSVAKQFGFFLLKTKELLSEPDIKFFMNVYLDISTSQMDSIREMCAYNFPAIVSIFGTPGVSSFKLDKILDNLCNDSVLEVRARIAACFHEISRVFGNESYQILKPAFMKLLNDKESDVSSLIFKNISKVLEYFSLDETSKKIESQLELITILVKREKEVHISSGYSWRLHLEYLDQFTSFELYFEPDQLHDHFTGLLIKHFSDPKIALPIHKSIIKSLVLYLRKFKKTEHREHLLRTLKELKTSSNYAKRLLFLDVASQVLEIFSKKFFKLFFFQDLMDISKDSVVNVRIKYISMVPLIYETFALPNDSNLLSKLNDSLKRLTCDLNPEIALHASEIMNKINNGSGGKQNLFRLDAATIGIKREQDRLREEEEKSFLSDWDASSNSILPSASDVKPSRRQSISAGSGLVRSNSTPKANNSAKEATTVVKRTSKKMVSSIDEDISSPLSSAASLAAQLDRLNNSNGKLDSKKDGNNRVQSTETLGSFNNLGRNDKLAAKPTEAKAPKVDKKKEEETRKKMEEESKKILLRPTSSTKSTKEKEEVLGKISTQLKMRGLTSLKKV